MDWNESFQNVANDVAGFLPKLVAFLVILIVGLFLARLIAKGIDLILERIGFDRAVERGGIKDALANSQYDASDIASKIVFYALALFVLQLAFSVFGPNAVSDLISGVIAFLPKLFVALVIVVVAAAIAEAVKDIVRNALSGTSYGALLATLSKVTILAIGIIAALNQIDVATTVTTPILVAILATVGGVVVVGVGGGLVRPMQTRWDGWLSSAEQEAQALNLKKQSESARPTVDAGIRDEHA
jgi:hypothetical protein